MYLAALLLISILLLAYCILIVQYRKWFCRLQVFEPNKNTSAATSFSVIIPARNEEANIETCLRGILQQPYPKDLLEVIVVNDHSTDGTADVIKALQQEYPQLHLINLADHVDGSTINAYKKKAIELAISKSQGDWIITTDADCNIPERWLELYDASIQTSNHVLVAGPVMFTHHPSILSLFQLLDFLSLQGITAAAVSAGYHTMCNGANLAYKKEVFYEVGQFKGIDQLASGDDMLLMYKIKQQYPTQLGYLFHPAAIVTTAPMQTWNQFLNQRIRWASKADRYDDRSVFRILALVYAVNLGLVFLLPINLFVAGEIAHWLTLMLIKIMVELYFLWPVSKFYRHSDALLYFPLMQPLHLLYTVIAGWLGKFGSYQWKGRSVK
ncbi:glycosyltransferase [Sediminibacterium sp. KACHI17]|uniref:glycosyltransferase family 2 protein n=1 Tax=Sediminibacterium sp. KACHI17 TaxID=1751071 RepID=UPI0033659340